MALVKYMGTACMKLISQHLDSWSDRQWPVDSLHKGAVTRSFPFDEQSKIWHSSEGVATIRNISDSFRLSPVDYHFPMINNKFRVYDQFLFSYVWETQYLL